ncbi:MAG: IspD/TarI family cytidylyltransferase, partial [bacterium]
PEALNLTRSLFKEERIKAIVAGGETREHSVFKGLEEVRDSQFVLVHDGDRPCLTPVLVKRVLEELKGHQAVLPVLPVKETLKALTPAMFVKETLGKGYWLAQTPQGFSYQVLKEAFLKAENAFHAPDDAQIVEQMGVPVKAISGEETNIKVTTPLDFQIAEMILRGRESV